MSTQIVDAITQQLDALIDPYTGASMTAKKALQPLEVTQTEVRVRLQKGYPLDSVSSQLTELVRESLAEVSLEKREVDIQFVQKIVPQTVQQSVKPIAGIKNIIAVASGKGGVGKSTVSANLALALQASGAQVAVLDADIYGPSQPRMLGIEGKPQAVEDKRILPMQNYGLSVMSIGFLVEQDTPMIWRGPMVTQALEQLLRGTIWNHQGQDIDYMIVDLPPGTGDIQLTLSQRVPVSGAVIVTTPQDIALLDARKAYKMFEKVDVPVLGVIENMSTHLCSNCGHEDDIFGTDGAAQMAEQYDLEVLGNLPLERQIREQADKGKPTVVAYPESETAQRYFDIALKMCGRLSLRKQGFNSVFPDIVVEPAPKAS